MVDMGEVRVNVGYVDQELDCNRGSNPDGVKKLTV